MFVYKENPYRSVLLDDSCPEPRVIKRFHHPKPWRALRDAARARGEFRALQRYEQAGLPVPHPIAIELERAIPSFSMQAIQGAQPLEALLAGSPPPVPWEQLMASLGRLLAQMQARRVEHPDLHPGNVLVSPAGELFLVDLRGSRWRKRRPSATRLWKALVAAEAEARDHLPAGLRARFFVAWQRASEANNPINLERLQWQALCKRRAFVKHGARRWLRRSSRCSVHETSNTVIYRAKLHPGFKQQAPEFPSGQLHLEGKPEILRQLWLNAARCVEHRLEVAWPLELELSRTSARASFALATSPGFGSAAENLPQLEARFRERGLSLGQLEPDAWIEAQNGARLLRPPARLLHLTARHWKLTPGAQGSSG